MHRNKRLNHGRKFVMKRYQFVTNNGQGRWYDAESLENAKHLFQEDHGYWPEKGVNYVVPVPTTEETTKGE